MNSLQFSPLRVNSLQFLPFKGEIFASFTFLRFFGGEKDKKSTLVMVNSLKFSFFSPFEGEFFAFFLP